MHKISSRDIRTFVAGALALIGLRSLISIPYLFTGTVKSHQIAGLVLIALFAFLDLLLGLGIFLGRWSALFWTQIYLWLIIISGCMVIPIVWYLHPAKGESLALRSAPDFLTAAVLLALIFWSTSEKFRYEPDAL